MKQRPNRSRSQASQESMIEITSCTSGRRVPRAPGHQPDRSETGTHRGLRLRVRNPRSFAVSIVSRNTRKRIVVDGIELTNNIKNIEKIRAEVGMVFQHFNLFLTHHPRQPDLVSLVRKVPRNRLKRRHALPEKVTLQSRRRNIRQLSGVSSSAWHCPKSLHEPKVMLFDSHLA